MKNGKTAYTATAIYTVTGIYGNRPIYGNMAIQMDTIRKSVAASQSSLMSLVIKYLGSSSL